ncbi:MAG: asparagine--tRNA ligase [Candidatus Aminicenantes bacterium]|nr:asparagine--tRNA ligase [Candidatus Aminicenantes bacterium]
MKMDFLKSIFADYKSYVDREVKIGGWIRSIRDQKTFGFIMLNDGTFFKNIQVVFDDNLENFARVTNLTIGSSIIVTGRVVESPGTKQDFEIKVDSIEIVGVADPDFPIQKKRHTFEFLRTIAHLRPRTNTYTAVFRVRSLLAYALHKFFIDRGFVYVHTPIITGSDCEGAGEMFRVTTLNPKNPPLTPEKEINFAEDFFGKETNLTVSGQLEVENFCMAFRNVYTFGPTFRAENSNTQRHASEFWMIEPEIAFADISDNMDLAEDMMKYICKYILDNAPEEMEFFNTFIYKGLINRMKNVIDSDFMRITYSEAIELLKKSGRKFQYPVEWGTGLQSEHERYITEEIYKKPVFVTDYPKKITPFYMRLNDDEKTVANMDLLVPEVGEIVGGSQREERYDLLEKRIDELGLEKKDYWWYLDLRRYGTVPHSGYGLGFERTIMYVTGMENIRDVIPFPRTPKNAEF